MKRILACLFLLMICFSVSTTYSQNDTSITTINVDDLTDAQVERFWEKAKSQGYNTLNKLEMMAKVKGMPLVQIEKLKQRINNLSLNNQSSGLKGVETYRDSIPLQQESLFGITERQEGDQKKNPLFGYDFFNNPKISFTPNINVATPQNYQLGAGDVIQIDVWGAAEASYTQKINKQGAIKIQGVGQINLSGLSFEMATSKIKSYLKHIYSGISAPKNSYNKVYVGIALAQVRTVQVNIVGEVKTPGTYSLSALSNVLNALYASGGPTKDGTFRQISLIRNGKNVGNFDFYQYLLNGNEQGNLQLRDQDVIIVRPYENLVEIQGEVKRPGMYEIKRTETMQDLLTYSGGYTAKAYQNVLIVERVKGMEREIKEVTSNQLNDFSVQAGDRVTIQKIVDKFSNRVRIEGAVYQPGNYEFSDGIKISEFLKKASGVKKNAFLSRALITRYTNDGEKKIVAFSVTDVLRGNDDVLLQPDDTVYVYSKDELREKRTVRISGAVNQPKEVDFAEGMTVEDLIALASGLKEGADPQNIEVSRRLKDGSFQTVGKVFSVKTHKNLNLQKARSMVLEPYDVVYVRHMKGYTPQKNVSVKGEVTYPGEYSLTTKNDRISDLINRAGGLSPYAYAKGATLVRKKTSTADKQQEKLLEDIKRNDTISLSEIKPSKTHFRIGINLGNILKNPKSDEDIFLQEGDELLIPVKNQTVEVQGAVYSPSLVRYVPGKPLKYYIEGAGGFSQKAKKSKTYVLYSNGRVDATNNFLFFKNYPTVEPGATILVPKKEERKKLSAQEIIGITTGVATLGVLIDRLVK